jgi:flagellar basal body-associated protein FliL
MFETMKCDACGAPVENGKCTYCGKTFATQEATPLREQHTTININNINGHNVAPKNQEPKNKKQHGCLTRILQIFLGFILFCAIIGILSGKSDNETSSSEAKTETEVATESVWATDVTPIDEFDYYLDGDFVYLKKYQGSDKKVRVGTSYEIEGKVYQVADTIEALFTLKSVTSVILPEGITTMPNNTFNSCGVEYVYIPKSLKPDGEAGYGFYEYFHDVEKIYYGGTEEEWAALTNHIDRADIDAKQIIYEASVDDLE